jgi:hypothetical protein
MSEQDLDDNVKSDLSSDIQDYEDEDEQIDEKHNLLLLQRELEMIERDCEQMRRENALLQSWL